MTNSAVFKNFIEDARKKKLIRRFTDKLDAARGLYSKIKRNIDISRQKMEEFDKPFEQYRVPGWSSARRLWNECEQCLQVFTIVSESDRISNDRYGEHRVDFVQQPNS